MLQFGNMNDELTRYNTQLFGEKVAPDLRGMFADCGASVLAGERRGGVMSNTIVYLPGIAGDAGVSPALQQLVDDGRRVVIPPVPGFDGATGFTPPHDYLDWLVVFWDAIDASGATADGPVDVVGASVGGMIAAELAVLRPEVVARLALLAPFGIADENDIGFDLYATRSERAARPPVREGRARAGRRLASPTSARRRHRSRRTSPTSPPPA